MLIRTLLAEVVLRKFLIECGRPGRGYKQSESESISPFEGRLMTVRLRREAIFNEGVFILNLSFLGVKYKISEVN